MDHLLTEYPVSCPFCAETITLLVDTSAGSQEYVEDCHVCCRPLEITLVASAGEIESLDVDYAG